MGTNLRAALSILVGLLVWPADIHAQQQANRIQAPELRTLASSYDGIVTKIKKLDQAIDQADDLAAARDERLKQVRQLVDIEDQILSKLGAASPDDLKILTSVVTETRFALDHRSPLDTAEKAIRAGVANAPLLALDLGQIARANALLAARTDGRAVAMRKKIDRAQQIVRADSPEWKCAAENSELCGGLYSLLGLPPRSAGRLQALEQRVTKRSGLSKQHADPRKINRDWVADVWLAKSDASLSPLKDVNITTTAWKSIGISGATLQALNDALKAGAPAALASAAKIIDLLIQDQAIKGLFGKNTKLVNGVTAVISEDDAKTVALTLQDVVEIGPRRFLVVKSEGYILDGGMHVFEVPAGGATLWHWRGELSAGGISYAVGNLTGPNEKLLFIWKTESSANFLTLWIVDPQRRRVLQIFDEEQAYHGAWFVADIDGSANRKIFISRMTGERRYDMCNQCPSRVQNLVFEYLPAPGTVRLLSNYVSWNDLGSGANRDNLMGLGPEVGRGGLAAEIQQGLVKLETIIAASELYEPAAELADNIARLLRSKAFAEAGMFADRALRLVAAKPDFDKKRDVVAFLAGTAAEANLEQGNVQAAASFLGPVDPFGVEDARLRDIVIDLQLRSALASGGLQDQYAALKRLIDRNSGSSNALSHLADYLLRVGNADEALRLSRRASDQRAAVGESWTADLYRQAVALSRLGQYQAAVAVLTILCREVLDSRESTDYAKALLIGADIAIRTENFGAARHLLNASFAQMDAVAWSEEGPSALLLYGRLLRSTGKSADAKSVLDKALRIGSGRDRLVPALRHELAITLDALGDAEAAAASAKTAFDAIVGQQTTVAEESHKLSFVASNAEIAEQYIARIAKRQATSPADLVDALESWRAQVLRSMHRNSAKLSQGAPRPSALIGRLAQGGKAYVTYYLDRSTPIAVVAEQGKFRTVALDIAPEFLDETRQAVHRFMDVSRPEAIESIWQDRAPAGLRTALAAIHDKLVKPLDLAAETKTLFIVPDERLFWVPWPALMAQQERFLFEDYIALVSPSALLLEESEPPHSVSRYLAIGSTEKIESGIIKAALSDMYLERAPASLPPLSSARQEVTDIQNAFGAGAGQGILIPPDGGSEPNLSKLLEAIATANIVHIAAHGVFNPNNPMASVIFVLPRTQAGVLRPTDFSSANLAKTSLVALSACQTGVTEVLRGGEAMGFVRGILLGGARRVLVANWIVEDRPTQEFFRAFYAQLKAGDGYATAYRNAMLDLSKRYRHPFYWAAYTMYANILN